jgi:hypothetical protein
MTSRASRLSSSSISTALSVPARFRMPTSRSLMSTTCLKPCLQQVYLFGAYKCQEWDSCFLVLLVCMLYGNTKGSMTTQGCAHRLPAALLAEYVQCCTQGISNVARTLNPRKAMADLMFWGLKAGMTPLRTLFQLAEAVGAVRMLWCPLSPNICRHVGARQPSAEACMLLPTKDCVRLQHLWHRHEKPLRMLHMHCGLGGGNS